MIYSTQELYLKYQNYKTPHIKLETEVKNKRLFKVVRGLYEDKEKTDGYLLVNYIRPDSYISFEYAFSYYGLIPERVYEYTCATTMKKSCDTIETNYGRYSFHDVPTKAYMYGVNNIREGDYVYLIASPEKALCDELYKKKPVYSIKQLKELLFDDLRIDEEEFMKLNKEDILFLCPLYRKKNLNFLMKYIIKLDH